jgi:pimeloyl-ACP methyl ester carboxylesterase
VNCRLKMGFIIFAILVTGFACSASADCMDNINLKFYGSSLSDFQAISMPRPITSIFGTTFWSIPSLPTSTQYYDPSKSTLIYVHGLFEGLDKDGPPAMITAYLQKKNLHNVVLYDHSSCGEKFSTFSTHQLSMLRQSAALAQMNLDFAKVHIIGYGFGTFIAANVGRKLDGNLKRITGLEPASALDNILGPLGFDQLESSNAQFVDVIHTDSGFLGEKNTIGHVDFWVNGGWSQNGCPTNVISFVEFFGKMMNF